MKPRSPTLARIIALYFFYAGIIVVEIVLLLFVILQITTFIR